MNNKYSDEFVRKLREEKKTATMGELSSKYKMSKPSVKYLIYTRRLQPLYDELEEAKKEVKEKTTIVTKILKALRL